MLHIQKYLLEHSLEQLKKEFGINHRIDGKLVSLNYDQIESKPGLEITDECRGLILSRAHYTEIKSDEIFGKSLIIAKPLKRFYNYGDPHASPISFSDPLLTYFEKLDGTLCILYHNPWEKKWEVATRSVARANLPVDGFKEYTFRKLFERALYETLKSQNKQVHTVETYGSENLVNKETSSSFEEKMWSRTFDDYTSQLKKQTTYCFELTTPLNRVVVEYKEFRVHVIATIDTFMARETWPGYPAPKDLFGVPWCPSHRIGNLNELIEFVNSKSPFEHEGIVVRDRHGNRVKIKNAAYAAYNRTKDLTAKSPRSLMELILLEKIDDVFPLLVPELQEKAMAMQDGLRKLIHKIDNDYKEIQENLGPNATRKDFALEVQRRKCWISPVMDIYSKKALNFKDYIEKQKIDTGTWRDGFMDSLIIESKKCNQNIK